MAEKKPQAGEWWQGDTTQLSKRAFVCGFDRDGCVIWQTSQNSGLKRTTLSVFLESHRHLPECDSFEWQPETFPQYFVRDDNEPFSDCDHLVRTAKTKVHGINVDGSATETVVWSEFHNEHFARGVWKQITQSEAESRVKKQPEILQETSKPNYVRLWTHRTSGTVRTTTEGRCMAYPEIWTELKHDGTGFYLVDQQR